MLSDMTLNQAASKAIEILHRGYHATYYSHPEDMTFDEWLLHEYSEHYVYDDEYNESPVTVENIGQLNRAWEFLHDSTRKREPVVAWVKETDIIW
jgi:hypothetical protein